MHGCHKKIYTYSLYTPTIEGVTAASKTFNILAIKSGDLEL